MHDHSITFNGTIIYNLPQNQAFRFLGCWFARIKSHKAIHTIIIQEAEQAIKKLRQAKIMDKQAIYIINAIILTRLANRTQNTFLPKSQCDQITQKYTNLTKLKAVLASTILDATIHYHLIFGLKKADNIRTLQHTSNLIKLINHPMFKSSTLKIRLQ